MSEQENGVHAAVEAGLAAADASDRVVDIEMTAPSPTGDTPSVPVAIIPAGMNTVVLTEALCEIDRRMPAPSRLTGQSEHQELDSFVAHINRFKAENSVVWADPNGPLLVAIYNYPAPGSAAWGDHRATYSCPKADEWKVWMDRSGHHLGQDPFADFIDERMDDLVEPTKGEDGAKPIELLEMARNLAIHSKGRFERKVDVTTGEHSMVCKLEHGESSTKIPKRFFVALRVFEGGPKYKIEARVRFRLVEGVPSFLFSLHRADEIFRDAFNDVQKGVGERTKLPVYVGTPESWR